ncbi:cell envelope integrity protein CreD [Pseudomonas sp. BMS12]|uniref:cell envelope integrity protein CreD n=1 Tax=Pseudomonas sp. BMS12 TaxID=1796033 RepID=UPI00083AEB95|nr:cell envelope integrity protein CreD [Pseudomonas sp. BMS12]
MNRNLLIKLGAIAVLIVLLMIPIIMIDGMVEERQSLRDTVLEDIARSSSYSQKITGPLLVVPYRKTEREWKTHPKTGERYLEESERYGRLYVLPERFVLDGQVSTELRARGIYQARLFQGANHISGHFQIPAHYGISEDLADYRFDTPFVSVGISDVRGIKNAPELVLGEQRLAFQPGSSESLLGAGVHAPIPQLDTQQAQRLDYAFDLQLQGTGRLDITPVGRDSRISLSADWPHPSFVGEYLPSEREITSGGFTALWQTSFFATNLEEALGECAFGGECRNFESRHFGVSFVDPVDQYLKSDRALKYALLFVVLTFAGFFLFEVLKRLAVHPVQYGLVGLSLAMFYLLLLSLAEHMDFARAYALAAGACVLLIGFYVSHVLRSWLRGAGFTVALAGLYAMLYALLSAEDYALLMGSLLVFGLLAAVMVLTRKLDWYGLAKPAA